jgi:hypothetical protein
MPLFSRCFAADIRLLFAAVFRVKATRFQLVDGIDFSKRVTSGRESTMR